MNNQYSSKIEASKNGAELMVEIDKHRRHDSYMAMTNPQDPLKKIKLWYGRRLAPEGVVFINTALYKRTGNSFERVGKEKAFPVIPAQKGIRTKQVLPSTIRSGTRTQEEHKAFEALEEAVKKEAAKK